MEVKTFKKLINDVLVSRKFKKRGSYYCLDVKDIIIVIGLQKSNYAKGYYINIGYIILQLNASLEKPRDVDGDVRTRFGFVKGGKENDFFDLEKLSEIDENCLIKQFEENIKQYIEPITSLDSLKTLLQRKPVLLYQTKISAKQLLQFG
jgi:hypothetical protein